MTNTKATATTADEIWAKLDALDAKQDPAQDPKGLELVAAIHTAKAAGDPRPGKPMEPPAPAPAPAPAAPAPSKGRQLAARELAGITSGQHRLERNRPAKGKQRELAVPVTTQGRLGEQLGELTAGRSRRYTQDLEGWCRASLADPAQRGVLVLWDGVNYRMQLSPNVSRATVLELREADRRGWLDSLTSS
jgi:hypothetical protein